MSEAARVLIIDDEQVIREGCERSLKDQGYQIAKAENGTDGIELMKQASFDIVLLDLMMPGIDGFEVLAWVKQHRPETQVIVITGFATVSKAVFAMKQGAFDFVGKPFTPDYIRIVTARALEKRALEAETERLKHEKTRDLMIIAEEQSRLKTVFSCMIEAVIITNRHGVVVHHNPSAIRVLQIETDPVVGKPLALSIHDKNAIDMVREAVEQGCVVTREFPPGSISRQYLRAYCSPVLTSDGEILGSVTVFEDVTTQKLIDRQKSEFVAMVAHDLRAPLASIEQMIYAIQATCDMQAGTACERLQGRMTVRIKELMQMIANLLSLSKLESDAVAFNMSVLNGNEILKSVIDILQPQAEKKRIELRWEPCPDDWYFNADYDHIRSAFMNVVGNAIKYTPDGGTVEVAAALVSGLANVRVRDTGVGIGPDDLPHIFDRFFRAGGKANRAVTGSGLGLSVVKKVVEAHNGYVEVDSVLEKGTTFTLSFPLSQNQAAAGGGRT